MNGFRYELRNLGFLADQRPEHIVLCHSVRGGARWLTVREWGRWLTERGLAGEALRAVDRQLAVPGDPTACFSADGAVFSVSDRAAWESLRGQLSDGGLRLAV